MQDGSNDRFSMVFNICSQFGWPFVSEIHRNKGTVSNSEGCYCSTQFKWWVVSIESRWRFLVHIANNHLFNKCDGWTKKSRNDLSTTHEIAVRYLLVHLKICSYHLHDLWSIMPFTSIYSFNSTCLHYQFFTHDNTWCFWDPKLPGHC